MITINDLKVLASKMEVMCEQKDKEREAAIEKSQFEHGVACGNVYGLREGLIEVLKFINEQQLKSNN